MRLRNKLPALEIQHLNFGDFSSGKAIPETVPKRWRLREGDVIPWRFNLFNGTALVISAATTSGECIAVLKNAV